MKRLLVVGVVLFLAGTYIGAPVKGDDTPKERTYVAIFYCLNAQSAINQRQGGKHKIVVGYSLPSLTPDADDMKGCARDGGVLMTGYVEVTAPLTDLN